METRKKKYNFISLYYFLEGLDKCGDQPSTHNEISIHIFYLIKFFDQVFLFSLAKIKNKQTNKIFFISIFHYTLERRRS